MRWALGFVVAVATWTTSTLAFGQSPSCTIPASDGKLPGSVRGTLKSLADHEPPAAYSAAVLQAFGEHYQTNGPVTLGEYVVGNTSAIAMGFAAVAFTVTASGAIDSVRLATTSLSPAFDQSVIAVVNATAADGLPPLPPEGGPRTRFRLEVTTVVDREQVRRIRDTAVVAGLLTNDLLDVIRRSVHEVELGASTRWATTTIPTWSHVRTAVQTHAQVAYPDIALRNHIEDSTLMQFVIGTDGRVTPGTVVIVRSTYRDFARAILEAVPDMRFRAATIGGCPIASLNWLPFTFKMHR
jgi:TonB family protein